MSVTPERLAAIGSDLDAAKAALDAADAEKARLAAEVATLTAQINDPNLEAALATVEAKAAALVHPTPPGPPMPDAPPAT